MTVTVAFELLLVLVGLAVVFVGVPLLAIRLLTLGRKKCESCGTIFNPRWSREETLCAFCKARETPSGTRMPKWRRALGWLLLLGAAALLVAMVGAMIQSAGLSAWAAYPAGLLFALGLLLAGALSNKGFRAQFLPTLRFFLLRSERLDFAAARRAAGRPGTVFRRGSLIVWRDAPDDIEGEIQEALTATAAEWSRNAGVSLQTELHLRVFCFEREAGFSAYLGGLHPGTGRWAGCCLGPRIVVCREVAEFLPSQLGAIVAHEAAHHFTNPLLPRAEPVWLSEGLASVVAERVRKKSFAPGAELRCFRAALARGTLLSGSDLAAVTRAKLAQRMRDWSSLADAAFARLVYDQGTALVRFLLETRAEPFRKFLAHISRSKSPAEFFRECFGLTIDEAVGLWIDGLKAAVVPPHQAPPDELKARIEKELVATVSDRSRPADARRIAIRGMSAGGWAWGTSALVEALDDPDPSLRAEAQRALENISGELRGSAPQSWMEWGWPAGHGGSSRT